MIEENTQKGIETHIKAIRMLIEYSDMGELNKSTIREALDMIKEAIK